MIKLYLKFLSKYKGKVFLVIFLLICSTLANLLLPMISKNIINNGIGKQNTELIIGLGAIMIVVLLIGFGIVVVGNYFSAHVSMSFSKDLRHALFAHSASFSRGDAEEIGTASLISRQTNDVMQMQMALVQMLNIMLMAPIMCVGGIVMAYLTAPSLSWIIALILPFAIVVAVVMMIKVNPLYRANQVKLDKVNLIMRETLTGMRVLRAFNKEEFEIKRFSEASEDLMKTSLKANRIMTLIMPIMTLCVNVANILIIWNGGHKMVDGTITYGDVQAFIQYVSMILMSLMMTSMLMIILPRAISSGERIREIFDKKPTVMDPENPETIPEGLPVTLSFEHVNFKYPGADENVLTDITFEAKAGETVAIIGGTGSGKSTLVNLISRAYDTTEGCVKVDGVDVRNLVIKDLIGRLGIVPQKAFLFAGSIIDNMRYGKKDASEEEVNHALKTAQAWDFVEKNDYGIYTYITQSGSNVSGGQRQRLAIARALVRKPEIYIFDDSFSALDFKTDAKLRKALKKEVKDSIMVIVAQRVGTIMEADQILVMDNGKIIGKGTHKELLKSNSVYREIALSQLSESEVSAS